MRNSALLISVAFMFAAQAAAAGQPTPGVVAGTELNAALAASVDSGGVKAGDEVTARTTQSVKSADGTILIPKGSTLIGVVTTARRHGSGGSGSGGAQAVLGIYFDRAVTSDGREIALDATLVALADARPRPVRRDPADPVAANTGTLASSTAHRAGGGALETVGGVVSGTGSETSAGRVTTSIGGEAGVMIYRSANAVGGVASNGRLISGSRGVFGIEDMEISSAESASAGGTLLVSPRRTVSLERDTQLLLVANGATTSQTQN